LRRGFVRLRRRLRNNTAIDQLRGAMMRRKVPRIVMFRRLAWIRSFEIGSAEGGRAESMGGARADSQNVVWCSTSLARQAYKEPCKSLGFFLRSLCVCSRQRLESKLLCSFVFKMTFDLVILCVILYSNSCSKRTKSGHKITKLASTSSRTNTFNQALSR
jgi:hypothetical protein